MFTSLNDLISLAKSPAKKSLATLKPTEILDFIIEKDEKGRTWNAEQHAQMVQLKLFEKSTKQHEPLRKLPYKYKYVFKSEGDKNPHRMMLEDWEVGALYWNTLKQHEGDEKAAYKNVQPTPIHLNKHW